MSLNNLKNMHVGLAGDDEWDTGLEKTSLDELVEEVGLLK